MKDEIIDFSMFEGSTEDPVPTDYTDLVEIGDEVYTDCHSGFCTGSWNEVTDILTKYDEDTGDPYKVICCGNRWFDARDGVAMTPPTAYWITETRKKK